MGVISPELLTTVPRGELLPDFNSEKASEKEAENPLFISGNRYENPILDHVPYNRICPPRQRPYRIYR